jgi:hypothetical protein
MYFAVMCILGEDLWRWQSKNPEGYDTPEV